MRRWRVFSLAIFMLVLLSGCGKEFQSTLIPQGEVAKQQLDLMLLATGMMVFVVLVVSIIFMYVVMKFRRKKENANLIPEQIEGNHKLELIWTIIPIILLFILAVPTVTKTFALADTKEASKENSDALVVNVTARLYWWEFEYKNQKIITSQELVIPTGEKVYLNLKGEDIKHSFWVPSLAGKMDANTDNANSMWLEADKAGTYNGFCTEFCGASHALMQFKVRAVTPEAFTGWLKQMAEQHGEVASDASEQVTKGEEIFNQSCITCHATDASDSRPAAARIAPNLANFGDRDTIAGILDNTPENVKKWLEDPNAVKPGNKMAGQYGDLTDTEIDAVAAYLSSLKVE